eukprot:TRINITY_DN19314_c0_g1_i1.p1 TRINITY_DN19314_c0_g1~~TRINITY_DN19314_c0_g1_i1.p1  ORF type:complete len:1890 (+),score=348.77 TRINITY_DN19314_c0_g1_i1:52-5670(+)
MGEPLRVVASLLSYLQPLCSFLRGIDDADLPTDRDFNDDANSLKTPESSFWKVAADGLLGELQRSEKQEQGHDAKKARIRNLLQFAQTRRRAEEQLSSGKDHRSRLGLTSERGDLPRSVTQVLPGLLFTDDPSVACGLKQPTEQQLRLRVDEVIVVSSSSSSQTGDGSGNNIPRRFDWEVYRLFEDRIFLLFDEGKTVLVTGSSQILTHLLYGLLRRCHGFSHGEAVDYLVDIGRKPELQEDFQQRAAEVPSHGLSAGVHPWCTLSLKAHLRLLEESRHWSMQHAEPLLQATQALFASSLRWNPTVHAANSYGLSVLATLRAVRLELARLPNNRYAHEFEKLFSIQWQLSGTGAASNGSREGCCIHKEDGLLLELAAGDAGETTPAHLEEELQQALQDAVALPRLLIVAIERSCKPIRLPESLRIGTTKYRSLALLDQRGHILTRVTGCGCQKCQKQSVPDDLSIKEDDGSVVLQKAPVVVVLAQQLQEHYGSSELWRSWKDLILPATTVGTVTDEMSRSLVESTSNGSPSLNCTQICRTAAKQFGEATTFKLRVMSLASFELAHSSGRGSAWEEIEPLCVAEMPLDSQEMHLKQRLQLQLHLPPAWQLILCPESHSKGWQYLPAAGLLLDSVFKPLGWTGPLILVLCVLEPLDPLSRIPTKPKSSLTSFPWMPVLCQAWIKHQLVPLDVLLIDVRWSLDSYAACVARRIEDKLGGAYCTSFAVHERLRSDSNNRVSGWRLLASSKPIATQIVSNHLEEKAREGSVCFLPMLLWEAIPLAPSTTGRGLIAAQYATCLDDLTDQRLPLERVAAQKNDELTQALFASVGELCHPTGIRKRGTEAEEFFTLLLFEERLLVAWVQESEEAVEIIAGAAQKQIDFLIAMLRESAPDHPPTGLKEWPQEFSGRMWEKISRAASAHSWAADITEAEVTRNLIWAEISNMQDIVLSMAMIRVLHGRSTLRLDVSDCSNSISHPQVACLAESLLEVVHAERSCCVDMSSSPRMDEFFSHEVPDLPSDCDVDIAQLHAMVQTVNAELNSVWKSHRQALQDGDETQHLRVIRMRELAMAAPLLLIKQMQFARSDDALQLGWLQHIQQGCREILHKSKLLCEFISTVAGLPAELRDEDAVAAIVEDLVERLDGASDSLAKLLAAKRDAEIGGSEPPSTDEAEEILSMCDRYTLQCSILSLALERQLQASVKQASSRIAASLKATREKLHVLTPRVLLVRILFELPIGEDLTDPFEKTSHRRGKKLRLIGRGRTRMCDREGVVAEDDAVTMEAASQAADKASALLELEDAKEKKKQLGNNKHGKKRQQPKLRKASLAAKLGVDTKDSKPNLLQKQKNSADSKPKCSIQDTEGLPAPHVEPALILSPRDIDRQQQPLSMPNAMPCESPKEASLPPEKVRETPKEVAPPEESHVHVLLEKEVFSLLGERRKARLLAIEASSGAQCRLEASRQSVLVSGLDLEICSAKQMLLALCVQWIEVTEPAWVVLWRGRSERTGHLRRLEEEVHCSVLLERESCRLRVAGTSQEVESARLWLHELESECDSAEVHFRVETSAEVLHRAEVGLVGVQQRRKGAWWTVRAFGIKDDVRRAVDVLQSVREAVSPSSSVDRHECSNHTPDASTEAVPSRSAKKVQFSRRDFDTNVVKTPPRSSVSRQESSHRASNAQTMMFHPSSSVDRPAFPQRISYAQNNTVPSNSLANRPDLSHCAFDAQNKTAHPRPSVYGLDDSFPASDAHPASKAKTKETLLRSDAPVFLMPNTSSCSVDRIIPSSGLSDSRTGPRVSLADQLAKQFPMARIHIGAPDALADQLAKQFPTARIHIGAPDAVQQFKCEQPKPTPQSSQDERLQLQMLRLKEMIEKDKAGKKVH